MTQNMGPKIKVGIVFFKHCFLCLSFFVLLELFVADSCKEPLSTRLIQWSYQVVNSVTPLSTIDKRKFQLANDMSFGRSQRALISAIICFEIASMVLKLRQIDNSVAPCQQFTKIKF